MSKQFLKRQRKLTFLRSTIPELVLSTLIRFLEAVLAFFTIKYFGGIEVVAAVPFLVDFRIDGFFKMDDAEDFGGFFCNSLLDELLTSFLSAFSKHVAPVVTMSRAEFSGLLVGFFKHNGATCVFFEVFLIGFGLKGLVKEVDLFEFLGIISGLAFLKPVSTVVPRAKYLVNVPGPFDRLVLFIKMDDA